MFKSLRHQLGAGKDRENIDREHIVVSNIIKRQSEHFFPQGSMRNGLIDTTKCQSSERKGNFFWLLCTVHKTKARNVLQTALQLSDRRWSKFLHFIKCILLWKNGSTTAMTRMRSIYLDVKYQRFLVPCRSFSQDQITQMVTVYQKCMAWLKCSHI